MAATRTRASMRSPTMLQTATDPGRSRHLQQLEVPLGRPADRYLIR